MKNKSIIFFNYRAGSHLTLQLINDSKKEEKSNFLLTDPPYICGVDNLVASKRDVLAATVAPHSWYMYIGDWWGHCNSSEDVPTPYGSAAETRWAKCDLERIPGDNWKFVNITRDPRNWLESWRSLSTGGYEEKQQLKFGKKDYFVFLCKSLRNRVRVQLDCNATMDNYKLVTFEDLLATPLETVKDMYDFIDLKLDEEGLKKRVTSIKEAHVIIHSSFSDTNFNSRWSGWTDEEKNTFKEILGKELIELGYVENNNW